LNRVLDFGFDDLNLRIQAGCAVANIGSIKVLEKAGMLEKDEAPTLKSGWSDNFEYAILETDDRNRTQSKTLNSEMWFYFAILISMT
jgi:RimJ/RimL family protein N-acetyltransferase